MSVKGARSERRTARRAQSAPVARRWSVAAVLLAAVAVVHGEQRPRAHSGADWEWPAAAVVCAALGALAAVARRRLRGRGNLDQRLLLAIGGVLVLLSMGYLGGRAGGSPLRGLALGILGALSVAAWNDRERPLAPWVALGCAVFAHAASPGPLATLLVLSVAACAGAGLVGAHHEATLERFVGRRATRGVPSPNETPEAAQRAPGQRRAALVAALLAVGALALVGAGRAAWERALGQDSNEAVAAPGGTREQHERALRQALQPWLSSVSMGSQAAQRTDEILATVALRDGRTGERIEDAQQVYFTVAALDVLRGDRMERSTSEPSRVLRDADDGAEDGWIELARPPPRAGLITATFTQDAARTARGGLAPLVRLEPLLAVRLPELVRQGDGVLLAPSDGARLEYALAARARAESLDAEHTGAARHPEPRYLDLPSRGAALNRLAGYARELVADAPSDARRVLAVVEHFRTSFAYSEEGAGAEGLEGLVAVVERRSGYCASIAAACVVMLRSLGVPARAVAGVLGSEFDPEAGVYVLRQRHAHAWVEAHFEGLGWVRLDPTPADTRPRASPAAERSGDLAAWSAQLADDLRSLVSGASDASGVAEAATTLAAHLAQGPAVLAAAAGERQPVALAILVAGVAASLHLLLRGARRAVASARVAASAPGRALAYEQRLIRALVARGGREGAARTLLEIARSVPPACAATLTERVERAVRVLYAARFGGAELHADARREIEAVIDALRSGGDPIAS